MLLGLSLVPNPDMLKCAYGSVCSVALCRSSVCQVFEIREQNGGLCVTGVINAKLETMENYNKKWILSDRLNIRRQKELTFCCKWS